MAGSSLALFCIGALRVDTVAEMPAQWPTLPTASVVKAVEALGLYAVWCLRYFSLREKGPGLNCTHTSFFTEPPRPSKFS